MSKHWCPKAVETISKCSCPKLRKQGGMERGRGEQSKRAKLGDPELHCAYHPALRHSVPPSRSCTVTAGLLDRRKEGVYSDLTCCEYECPLSFWPPKCEIRGFILLQESPQMKSLVKFLPGVLIKVLEEEEGASVSMVRRLLQHI